MPTSSLTFEQIEQFKQRFEKSAYNFAYEMLLLEMKIQEFTAQKQHQSQLNTSFIQEITRIMELYMLAVQLLESSSDKRFNFFRKKIQNLMMKKVIVQQLHTARGIKLQKRTIDQVVKAELDIKKQQHQMQMYFHQQQTDLKKAQQIVKRSQMQAVNVQGRIRNHLTSQQKTLEQRIKSRKKRSQAGSVTKFKLVANKTNEDGFNVKEVKEKQQKAKQRDIRMEYFVDCKDSFDQSIQTPPKKRLLGSAQKPPLPGYQNRFAMTSPNVNPKTK